MLPNPHRASELTSRTAPQRVHPRRGELLSMDSIRGKWRPSGTVDGAIVFSIVWGTTPTAEFRAPLHDFDRESRDRLIDACREQDQEAALRGIAREDCHALNLVEYFPPSGDRWRALLASFWPSALALAPSVAALLSLLKQVNA